MNELWSVQLVVEEHNSEVARDIEAIRRARRLEGGRRSGLPVRLAAILREFADRLDSEAPAEQSFHRLADG